jgi:HEAT repeats
MQPPAATRAGRLRIAATVAVVILAAAVAGRWSGRGPVAGGHSAAEWIRLAAAPRGLPVPDGIVAAMGTDALPVLQSRLARPMAPVRRVVLAWWDARRGPGSGALASDDAEAEAAAEWCGRLGPPARRTAPALIELLDNRFPGRLREAAARALGRIGPDAAGAIPALRRCLEGSDEALIAEARAAIETLSPPRIK